jgi:hypothetical protein
VDPLDEAEAAQALAALTAVRGASADAVRASVPDQPGETVVTAPAQEVLLVERHAEGKEVMASGAWERRADVLEYRYADDTLVHSIFNYATGTLEVVEEVQGVQPPLTESERQLAIELAFADPALRAHMGDEYRLITGESLTGPEQLDIRVFVYHAGANPETEPPEAAVCGVQRCGQLLILTADNVTFSSLPVVNLSTLSVARVVPLAVSETDAAGATGDEEHDHHDQHGDAGHEVAP